MDIHNRLSRKITISGTVRRRNGTKNMKLWVHNEHTTELSVVKCPTYDGLYVVSLTMNMLELWALPGQLTTLDQTYDTHGKL